MTQRPRIEFSRAINNATLTAANFYATGPDGSVLARSDDSGGTLNPSFEVLLPADGTYRVQVTAYGSTGGRAGLTVEGRVE